MMQEIVERTLSANPDMAVVARVPADADFASATRRCSADVLICLQQPDEPDPQERAGLMFSWRPSRVIAITERGRTGVVYALRPHATPLCELSLDDLVDAVRSSRQV